MGDLARKQIGAGHRLHFGDVQPAHHGQATVAVNGDDRVEIRPDRCGGIPAAPAECDRAVSEDASLGDRASAGYSTDVCVPDELESVRLHRSAPLTYQPIVAGC
jgi:hypothetical protein